MVLRGGDRRPPFGTLGVQRLRSTWQRGSCAFCCSEGREYLRSGDLEVFALEHRGQDENLEKFEEQGFQGRTESFLEKIFNFGAGNWFVQESPS
jgi:hypothetical protein